MNKSKHQSYSTQVPMSPFSETEMLILFFLTPYISACTVMLNLHVVYRIIEGKNGSDPVSVLFCLAVQNGSLLYID